MHPGGGVSLSESKADTQVSSFVNQLPIYGCVCVFAHVTFIYVGVCAYKSVCTCRGQSYRLIIAVTPSFIIFIEFFPVWLNYPCKIY